MNHPPSTPGLRILVADDIPAIHDDFRKILLPTSSRQDLQAREAAIFGDPAPDAEPAPFVVDFAFQGEEALDLMRKAATEGFPYALAFVDMRMPPGWDGVETIRHLWAEDPMLQVVICTAYSDHSWAETVRMLGSSDNFIVLKKPFDNVEVLQLAHALTRKWQVARELTAHLADLNASVARRTKELELANQRFAQAFEASPLAQAIQSLDNGRVLEVNSAFLRISGLSREQTIGHATPDFGAHFELEKWRGHLAALLRGESIDDHAAQGRLADGQVRDFVISARAIHWGDARCALWVLRDVTERLRLEQQLRQAKKMEAIGQLAAGIAHDFNNLLTVIQTYTSPAFLPDSLDNDTRHNLQEVHDAAVHASSLTRQLLIFSRKKVARLNPIEPSPILLALKRMLQRLIGEQIHVNWQVPDDLPMILGDEGSIEQIIINLAVNARDAMPGGGRLEISARPRASTEQEQRDHGLESSGSLLAITVADSGVGIPAEVLPRIFEPFFTTKEPGRGTGLGLATIDSIVRQHNGWVTVESTVGVGTAFTVLLPVAEGVEPSRPTVVAKGHPTAQHHEHTQPNGGGSNLLAVQKQDGPGCGRVLVVEDDPNVQAVLRSILQSHCRRLIFASDGLGALAAWDAAPEGIDLLITDVVMPNGLTGLELARKLRARKPSLKVIIITGYSSEILEAQRVHMEGEPPRVLMKPFNASALITAVDDALRATRDEQTCPQPAPTDTATPPADA